VTVEGTPLKAGVSEVKRTKTAVEQISSSQEKGIGTDGADHLEMGDDKAAAQIGAKNPTYHQIRAGVLRENRGLKALVTELETKRNKYRKDVRNLLTLDMSIDYFARTGSD
jgi:hypothetical protein